MERADEAGENRRANVSVHLAMQDEVYRYPLLLHGDLFSVKGAERVNGLKPSRFAWRCALLQCTSLSVGSCAIRYLWRYGKIRRCGKPAARLCPGHGTPLPRRRGSGVSDTAAAGLSECGHFPAPKDHREITGGSQGSDRADGQGLCRFGVEQQDMVAGQLK